MHVFQLQAMPLWFTNASPPLETSLFCNFLPKTFLGSTAYSYHQDNAWIITVTSAINSENFERIGECKDHTYKVPLYHLQQNNTQVSSKWKALLGWSSCLFQWLNIKLTSETHWTTENLYDIEHMYLPIINKLRTLSAEFMPKILLHLFYIYIV